MRNGEKNMIIMSSADHIYCYIDIVATDMSWFFVSPLSHQNIDKCFPFCLFFLFVLFLTPLVVWNGHFLLLFLEYFGKWKIKCIFHQLFFVGLHTFLASTFINWFASFCYWAIRFFASAVYPSVWLRSMQNVNIVMANSQIYIELKEQQNEPKKNFEWLELKTTFQYWHEYSRIGIKRQKNTATDKQQQQKINRNV